MPDYNLGRAYGTIEINADTTGADRAAAAVAGVRAENAALGRTLGDTNQQIGRNEKAARQAAEATTGYKQRVNELREAEDRLKRTLLDSNATAEDVAKARRAHSTASRNAEEAEKHYQDAIRKTESTLRSFVNSLNIFARSADGSRRNLQQFTADLDKTERAAKSLASTLTTTLATAMKVVGVAGGVGIAGGALGGAAGSAGQGVMNLLSGAVEIVKDFSGAIALLPALAGGAATSLGVLAIGFQHVGDALGAMDDPKKFADAIRKMAPAAQEVTRTIASFGEAFKSAGREVQQALFAPMINDIKPLITTWLPQLMRAGQDIGNQFGQLGHTLAQVFMQPGNIQGFQTFIGNLSKAIAGIQPAIQPLSQAFATLGVVGSQSFGRISESIVRIANSFNKWVQDAAQSGELNAWINRAITSFQLLWDILKNFGQALNNVFAIGDKYGGNFLETVARIGQEFNNWTKSLSGQTALTGFFQTMQQASAAFLPTLKVIGITLLELITNLMKLGTAIGPGMESFFTGLGKALNILGQAFIQSAPAFNTFLNALGGLLSGVMASIGPQLPTIFSNFAEALTNCAPALTSVANAIAVLFSHLTAGEIEAVITLITTLRTLIPVLVALNAVLDANPVVLLIGAIAALTAGIIYAYTHFKTFHDIVNGFGQGIAGLVAAVANMGGQIASEFGKIISGAFNWGVNLISNFISGIGSKIHDVVAMAGNIGQIFRNFWEQHSPAKEGPLSQVSTEQMGQQATTTFATGIQQASSKVNLATERVAAEAASGFGGISGVASQFGGNFLSPGTGAGGGAFTSAGQRSTASGGYGSFAGGGKSGFDNYISNLTQDLSAWSKIAHDTFGVFQQVTSIVTRGLQIGASLWGGGVNPMTLPGGIFNTPGQGPQAPLPELTPEHYDPGNVPAVAQQDVPGVPASPKTPGPDGVGGSGFGGQSGSIAGATGQVQGQAPAGVVGAQTPLASALKAKGFGDKQIRLIEGFSKVEGNNPAGNPTLGWMDSQLGGDTSLQGHVDALAQQFKDRASVAGAFPENGSDREQANWIADVVGQNGSSSGPDGLPQPARADYVQRVINAMGTTDGAQGRPGAPGPAPAVGFASQPYGLPKGTNTGGYGSPEANKIFPQWVLDLGAQFGVKPSTYGTHQETDRGGEKGYAPNPQGQNRGIDWVGTREDMEKFAQALIQYGGAEGSGGALEQVIYQAGPGGTKYGLGGAGNVQPSYYPQSGDGSYDEHGGTDDGAHVHTRFSASVPPTLGQAIPAVPGLPPGLTDALTGTARATQGGGIDGRATGAVGALGLSGAALFALRRMSAARKAASRLNVEPGEALRAMNIDLGEAPKGLNIDLGPAPGGEFATLSPEEQLAVARDLQNYRGTGRAGGISGGAPQSAIDLYNRMSGSMGALPGSYADQYGGQRGRYRALGPEDRAKVRSIFESSGPLDRDALDKLMYENNPQGAYGSKPGEISGAKPTAEFGAVLGPGEKFFNAAAPALDAIAINNMMKQTEDVIQKAPQPLRGPMTSTALGILVPSTVAAGSAATGLGIAATGGLATIGAAGLTALSTATGPLSGQEPKIDYTKPGSIQAFDAQGRPLQVGRAAPAAPSSIGTAGGTTQQRRSTGWGWLPQGGADGGAASGKPVPVNIAETGGIKLSGSQDQLPPSQKGAPVPGMTRPGPTLPPSPVASPTLQVAQGVPGMTRSGPSLPNNTQVEPTMGGGGIGAAGSTSMGPAASGQSMMSSFGNAMSGVGTIAGDAFQVFDDIIKSIGAAANITDQLVRGFANTQDVVKFVQQFQTFITTAADVAKLVSDTAGTIGSFVGAGASADPSGSTAGVAAAFGAVSAISGLVNSALVAVNATISLGIQVYQEVAKYQAMIQGFTLGNAQTGQLAGNVQMLLNTQTGAVMAYSQDNPLNKANHQLPSWFANAYGGNKPATTVTNNNALQIYTGPGQTPSRMMADSMWLVGTGAPSVASVAGRD